MTNKEKFIDLIEAIIHRPAMYQVESVEGLALVFFGYDYACNTDEISLFINGFKEFTNNHLESKSSVSWERLIRFNSGGNTHSLELFYKIFKMYLESCSSPSSREGVD
jgi:hypothetical protein